MNTLFRKVTMHHQSLTVKVVRCEKSQIYPHNRRNSIHDALYVIPVYLHAVGRPTAALMDIKKTCYDPNITLWYSQSVNSTQCSATNKLWWPSYARERRCVFAFLCSVCALGSDACLMLSESPFFSGLRTVLRRFGRCQSASASRRAGCCLSAHWGTPGRHWELEASTWPEENTRWGLKLTCRHEDLQPLKWYIWNLEQWYPVI